MMRAKIACILVLAIAGCGRTRVPGSNFTAAPSQDQAAATAALDAMAEHILAHPQPASRLFVEGYRMRTLVAAHELGVAHATGGLEAALRFADSLVTQQRDDGYWHIGYDTGWVADMAAALAIFGTLEPHASPEQMSRYEAAAERFIDALVRDDMVDQSTKAIGVGFPMSQKPVSAKRVWDSRLGYANEPYMVSTALAGIAVQSWLSHRTGKPAYAARAKAALEWSLSRIDTSGVVPVIRGQEGPFGVAAYVQEGWMAADAWLEDPAVRDLLARDLPSHVNWLLRTQGSDGAWSSGVRGDIARTPAIVNFLLWYNETFGPHEDVRLAVQRASPALIAMSQFVTVPRSDKSRPTKILPAAAADLAPLDFEVLSALVGRPLAALARGRSLQPLEPEAKSLFGRAFFAPPLSDEKAREYTDKLHAAQRQASANPADAEALIWVGRRTAYLGRFRDAIAVFTSGIERWPDNPRLYRHRGHRYITLRQFDAAIADLEKAAALIRDLPDEVEPDGLPNKYNIPTSTLHSNIWYHLGLAYYLKGDFENARRCYVECMKFSTNDDMICATTDWLYMTLRRLGREAEARAVLEPIRADMRVLENVAYHDRLMLYKGERTPESLLAAQSDDPVEIATHGYGVGNWYFCNGEIETAKEIFQKVLASPQWNAFGYIAAEADLARLGATPR
jgi:tetratricopeptide (TPR) repeat protein